MSNNEEIAQFVAVTGSTPEAAVFYLDSAQGESVLSTVLSDFAWR